MITLHFNEHGLRSETRQGLLTPPPDESTSSVDLPPLIEEDGPEDDALDVAVDNGDLNRVRQIFDSERRHGHPVNRLGPNRLSRLLVRAFQHKDSQMAGYLIHQDVPFGTNHVNWAIAQGMTSFLNAFLERGWEINEQDHQGLPLLAKILDKIELVAWFLQHGANPNLQTNRGVTPLSMAVANYSLEHVRIMLSNGGSVNKGQLLHFAVCRQDTEGMEIAQLLLASGARVNSLMCEDDPAVFHNHRAEGLGAPLHYAASAGRLDMIELLLQYGADLNLQNTLGQTSLDVARKEGQTAVIKALTSAYPERHRATYDVQPRRQQISISDLCN